MNGIINVFKETDMTSFDVVAILRRVLQIRRIGHSGTLDPMATGVLPVLVGKATRLTDYLTSYDKEYIFTMRFGVETDTLDRTGTILREESLESIDPHQLEDTLPLFLGKLLQKPPMYSAVKINGKKLYEYARQGKTVDRQARAIEIYALELLAMEGTEATLRCRCSKGTYIRQLIADLAAAMGTCAMMTSLRRTKVGSFVEAEAISIAQLKEMDRMTAESLLQPADRAVLHFPSVILEGKEGWRASQGQKIALGAERIRKASLPAPEEAGAEDRAHLLLSKEHIVRVYADSVFLGLGVWEGTCLKMKKVIAESIG